MEIIFYIGLGCLVYGCIAKSASNGVSRNDLLFGCLLYTVGFGMISFYLYSEYNLLFIAGMLTTLAVENFFKLMKLYFTPN